MELTRKEIARIIAMHWGCPVSEWHLGKEYPFDTPFVDADVMDRVDNVEADVKLKLRPLPAITDEDAVEVMRATFHSVGNDNKMLAPYRGEKYELGFMACFRTNKARYQKHDIWWSELTSKAAQYLIQRGYAVPLFIAPEHPCNGKTAIEMGLAIPIE